MIKLITESFDDDYIKNTRKHMSDKEAERYIKKILRDNSIDLHDRHGNVGGVGWICIETYERGLPDGWQFTDDLTGISAYIDLDGNILRRYDDLETVYSDKYYRSQGGTRDIPESIRVIKEDKNSINNSISDFSLMIHAIHELTSDNQGSLKDNFDRIELYSNSLKDWEIETVQKHIDSIERNFDKALRLLNSITAESDELLNFLTAYGRGNRVL